MKRLYKWTKAIKVSGGWPTWFADTPNGRRRVLYNPDRPGVEVRAEPKLNPANGKFEAHTQPVVSIDAGRRWVEKTEGDMERPYP